MCNELIKSCNYIEHSKTHRDDSETEKSEAQEDITEKSGAKEDVTEKPELNRRRSTRIRTAV